MKKSKIKNKVNTEQMKPGHFQEVSQVYRHRADNEPDAEQSAIYTDRAEQSLEAHRICSEKLKAILEWRQSGKVIDELLETLLEQSECPMRLHTMQEVGPNPTAPKTPLGFHYNWEKIELTLRASDPFVELIIRPIPLEKGYKINIKPNEYLCRSDLTEVSIYGPYASIPHFLGISDEMGKKYDYALKEFCIALIEYIERDIGHQI